MKTALWFQFSRSTPVIVLAFMYLIWLIAVTDNILIHRIFSWHLLSFLLFIKLAYVMYFLWQKKQNVILGMRILSVTGIWCLLKCFWALPFCVGRSMKNAIYGLFSSHFIFCILSSLFPPRAPEVSIVLIRNFLHIPPVSHPAKIITTKLLLNISYLSEIHPHVNGNYILTWSVWNSGYTHKLFFIRYSNTVS